ncbi:MAG: glycosyltransferase, partial [Planctomycetes bacterium]|nr:glycosyltransferase [Planctomycetota bacterium]
MKILWVFPAYEPAWAFGGIVRCTSNLLRAMAQCGADISVYTTNADGRGGSLDVPLGKPVDLAGVSVSYFAPTFGAASVWDSRDLSRALGKSVGDFDIVYVSAIWQWIGISTGHLAAASNVPYVLGPHGSFHPAAMSSGAVKKRLYWQLVLKRCVNRASALHFTTEYERRVSRPLVANMPSFVAANALKPGLSSPAGHTKPVARSGDLNLLTVVRPDPVKRLDILLNALKRASEDIAEIHLVVVGDMENRYGLRMKALATELGLDKLVTWSGYQSDAALADRYEQADLFVLTSAHENFSMVVAEAMSAGLPVVVTNQVGLADDVESCNAGLQVR